MSHAVLFNLRSRLSGTLEHPGSGFDFNLVGETFDGAEAINRYIGPHLLHGQFDFPLYWAIRDTFAYDNRSVADTVWQAANIAQALSGRSDVHLPGQPRRQPLCVGCVRGMGQRVRRGWPATGCVPRACGLTSDSRSHGPCWYSPACR